MKFYASRDSTSDVTADILAAALAAHRNGHIEMAEPLYLQALAARPLNSDAWHLLGLIRHHRRSPDASALIERALTLTPSTALYHGNLGIVLASAGRKVAAEVAYRRALACQPFAVDAHDRLGRWLRSVGRPHRALPIHRRALALLPSSAPSLREIGHCLVDLGQATSACPAYRRALILESASPEALFGLGNAFKALGQRAAIAAYRQALTLTPAEKETLANLALALQTHGTAAAATILYRRALAIWPTEDADDPRYAFLGSNLIFCLCYDPEITSAQLYAETRRWERRHAVSLYSKIRPHPNPPDPKQRLKIGYLSADLRAHPVAFNLIGLLRHHDPTTVEVHCYAEVAAPDVITERLQGYVPHWRSTVGHSDIEVAEMIRTDGIDILVSVAGHTAGNRLRICALKPAPIQASLFDLTTSGLATIDYWLTDHHLSPPEASERFVERLVHLPWTYLHEPPTVSPDVGPPPAQALGVLTFGSFNNPAKLNARVIALWARVLAAVPRSRLLLAYHHLFADPERTAPLIAAFARHGIRSERLAFLGEGQERRDHLSRHNLVDIALDPFPFGGCTTTFEALWMGVPVVSLAGQRFLGRMGASHLAAVGLDTLVAANDDDYVRIAADLALDQDRLAGLRAALRGRVTASPMLDAPAYARAMEAAFRDMWKRWSRQ